MKAESSPDISVQNQTYDKVEPEETLEKNKQIKKRNASLKSVKCVT